VAPLRGNVPTRIRRLVDGAFDAILLAGAGIERLNDASDVLADSLAAIERERLDPLDFVPAPAQGALAVQCRVSDTNMLASPVTGGGIAATRIMQNFLLGQRQGWKTPQELSQFVMQLLDAQGQKLVREGKTVESADETMAVLMPQATGFLDEQFPILKALQIE